jgi:hypothetical protein
MTKTGLLGPHPLAFDEINTEINWASPGVFALGYVDQHGAFRVNHVGRSDSDVRLRLHALIGSERVFKYRLYASPRAAFEKECELFHAFRPPCTRLHPDRPKGTNWTCPHCVMFAMPAR